MKKILLTSSSGGHFEQLKVLYNALHDKYDVYIITEKTDYIKKHDKIFLIDQINRKSFSFPFRFVKNHIKIKKYFKAIQPDIVISTGALCTISSCIIAHSAKKKVIFIESFAKIDTPTLTGKFVYKFADAFVVQWESLLKVYPKALYFGGGIY